MKTKLLLLLPVLLLAGCNLNESSESSVEPIPLSRAAELCALFQFELDYGETRISEFAYTVEITKDTIYSTDIYWHYEGVYNYYTSTYLTAFNGVMAESREINV